MSNIAEQISLTITALKTNMHFAAMVILTLWIIHIINLILGMRLNILGVYPRHPTGLIGIVCSPFLHGDFGHLIFNSIPLFLLVCFMKITVPDQFFLATAVIAVTSGLAVWLLGRQAFHVGASGVIFGYIGFLLANAYLTSSLQAVFIGALCLYYFGSMLLNIIPNEVRVSWEGHVFGLLSGVGLAFWLH